MEKNHLERAMKENKFSLRNLDFEQKQRIKEFQEQVELQDRQINKLKLEKVELKEDIDTLKKQVDRLKKECNDLRIAQSKTVANAASSIYARENKYNSYLNKMRGNMITGKVQLSNNLFDGDTL